MICPACGAENIEGSDRCENCLAPFRDLDIPRADAAEGLARSVMEDRLAQLEFEPTIAVTSGTSAIEAAPRMQEERLGCALVLDDGKLVGIFTEHDVLKRVHEYVQAAPVADAPPASMRTVAEELPIRDVAFSDIPVEEIRADEPETARPAPIATSAYGLEGPVRDFMSRSPESLDEDDSVATALNKMSIGNYRHLPVRRRDATYSVASIKAVLRYISREDW